MEISVKADIRKAQRFNRHLARGVLRAGARSMNDTIVTVRKEGAQAIKKRHPALRIGDIKREMSIKKAHQRKLRASVSTKGRPLSLKLFRATETKRGVSARIGQARKGLVRYHGRRAFVVRQYDDEIFVRRFGKGRQIRRFRGPSMPGVFRAQHIRFKAIAEERWPRAFVSRMRYEIERAKAKAR